MSAPMPQGPLQPDEGVGSSILIFSWVLCGFTAFILALRMSTVFLGLRRIRTSDYVMILAYVLIVIGNALMTVTYHYGLGRHVYYLTPEQALGVRKFNLLSAGFMVGSTMCGRMSFCFFLLNAVGTMDGIRRLLYVALVSQALVNMAGIILLYGGCGVNVDAAWDYYVPAKCISFAVRVDYLYFLSAWNAFTDCVLTLLPVFLLKNINMDIKKKIVVMTLLGLSGLACIAAIVKCYKTKEMSNPDYSYAIAKLSFWVMGEAYIVIIVASVPLMNSLVNWSKEKMSSMGYGGSTMASGDQLSEK